MQPAPPLDQSARLARREEARRRVRRQRRVVAIAALALAVLVTAGAIAAGLEQAPAGGRSASAGKGAAQPAPPPELPRGGREIFPRYRVVGFYGAPQADELGVLGIGSPFEAGRKLRRQARPYRRGGRPILPAMELIATIVHAAPGEDGKHRSRQTPATIRRYLRAARRSKALLILDIQPGRADFMEEVRAYRRWLREPDVGLALDPEWSMAPGQIPGQVIGSTTAAKVNEVSAYVADIVRRHNLPQKLLLVHQFTDDMIVDKASMRKRRGIALTVNVDGFGDRPNKLSKYRAFTRSGKRFYNGYKLFYNEDTNLMQPRDVLRMRPRPDLVMYE